MSSDNSDSDDSPSDFLLTDNIKREANSPSDRSSASSTSSSEEPNKPVIEPAKTSVDRKASVIKSPTKTKSPTKSNSSLSLNLQHYISKYEGRFLPQTKSVKALDGIDSDEEVFLVQASKDFNLKEFVDRKLNIKKTNNFETSDGITLECYVENFSKIQNLTLISGNKANSSATKVNTIKPSGKIIIREKLGETQGLADALSVMQPKKVPFPRDLKIRHPLFGAFYEDKINLSSKIVTQLQSTRKAKKIKIKLEPTEEVSRMEESDILEPVDDTPTKKHKKSKKFKRERSIELETVGSYEGDYIDGSVMEHSPKKKKAKIEKFDDDNDLSWLNNI